MTSPVPPSVCAAAGAAHTSAAITAATSRSTLPTEREASSENLRAPGQRPPREEAIGPPHRSRRELLDPPRRPELVESDRPEIRRAEGIDVEREVSLLLRPHRLPVLELPAPLVPRAHSIVHVEDERILRRVGAARERRPHIHE